VGSFSIDEKYLKAIYFGNVQWQYEANN
jgi:hypothetical protein